MEENKMTEEFVLNNAEVKTIQQFPKNHVITVVTKDGERKISAFGEPSEEIGVGYQYNFKCVQNGKYTNYNSFTLVDKLEVSYEDVASSPRLEQMKKTSSLKTTPFAMDSWEELSKALNLFGESVNIKATQTHIVAVSTPSGIITKYYAMVFYEGGQ
jgi:hypothetical protein